MSQELRDDFGDFDFVNDADRGANNLPEMLKYSPNMIGLIDAVMPEVQELNDAQQDIYATINIFEAVGLQLDNIFGEILNTEREQGQSDEDYRSVLLAFIPSVSGSGTIASVKQTARDITGQQNISLIEVFTFTLLMHIFVDAFEDVPNGQFVAATIKESKQAGVFLDIGLELNSSVFKFSDDISGGEVGEGFAESLDGSDGGTFARLLESFSNAELQTESGLTLLTESGQIILIDYGA